MKKIIIMKILKMKAIVKVKPIVKVKQKKNLVLETAKEYEDCEFTHISRLVKITPSYFWFKYGDNLKKIRRKDVNGYTIPLDAEIIELWEVGNYKMKFDDKLRYCYVYVYNERFLTIDEAENPNREEYYE